MRLGAQDKAPTLRTLSLKLCPHEKEQPYAEGNLCVKFGRKLQDPGFPRARDKIGVYAP